MNGENQNQNHHACPRGPRESASRYLEAPSRSRPINSIHSLLFVQTFKYVIYVSVPLVFGYGLGRYPEFWERTQDLVRCRFPPCMGA